MPGTYIPDDEVKASGEGIINPSGNLYIEKGRKFAGMKVRYFVMNEIKKQVEICIGCMKPVDECTGQYPICVKNGAWGNINVGLSKPK